MPTPRVSIVIPAHNKAGKLSKTLDSLLAQTLAASAFDIIVVDDHSTDETPSLLRRFDGRITALASSAPAPSAAAARNLGIAAARAPECLLLDADIVVAPSLLDDMLALDRSSRDVLLLPTIGSSVSDTIWSFFAPPIDAHAARLDDIAVDAYLADGRLEFAGEDGWLNLEAPWVFCWTTGVWLATALARRCGFDATMTGKGSEDIEFGWRLAAHGARFRMAPVAPVLHLPHARDRDGEERRDREHERAMLCRHPCFEMEMLCAFDASNANAALRALSPLRRSRAHPAIRLRRAGGDDVDLDLSLPSAREGAWPLLGVALPFAAGEFEAAVISDLRAELPESLICRIFQEVGRVARRVQYVRHDRAPGAPPRIASSCVRSFDHPYWERTHYVSRSYYDWRAVPVGRLEGADVLDIEWNRR